MLDLGCGIVLVPTLQFVHSIILAIPAYPFSSMHGSEIHLLYSILKTWSCFFKDLVLFSLSYETSPFTGNLNVTHVLVPHVIAWVSIFPQI